ncbi:zinc finger and SCAN domain-containing protein 5B-like [Suncus etruscus]|uniref:zinc finger and SCAN domain-containing protein 5B-like n=1 Tax=Suncus etruscus TaxID=109475 RepID=UPI00210F27A6|nr:zinc finger and SCAN domain-containing protein 5B-like [Suncus etruscus]
MIPKISGHGDEAQSSTLAGFILHEDTDITRYSIIFCVASQVDPAHIDQLPWTVSSPAAGAFDTHNSEPLGATEPVAHMASPQMPGSSPSWTPCAGVPKPEQQLTREDWHIRFRDFRLLQDREESDPLWDLQELKQLCWLWLRPDQHTKTEILDQLVLEQFLISQPLHVQALVRENKVHDCAELERLLWNLRPDQSWVSATPLGEMGEGAPREQKQRWMFPRNMPGREQEAEGLVSEEEEEEEAQEVQEQAQEMREELEQVLELKQEAPAQELEQAPEPGECGAGASGCGVVPATTPRSPGLPPTQSPAAPQGGVLDLAAPWRLRSRSGRRPAGPAGPESTEGRGSRGHASGGAERAPKREASPGPEPGVPAARDGAGGRRALACAHCHKTFRYQSRLDIHLRSHTGERPFRCARCGHGFMQRSDLRVHQRIHEHRRPYRCGLCGAAFTHQSTLTGHTRVHTQERPFACEHCGQRFSHRGNLNVHLRTHSGLKPYACPDCGRAFRQLGTFNRHRRTHLRAGPGRPRHVEVAEDGARAEARA